MWKATKPLLDLIKSKVKPQSLSYDPSNVFGVPNIVDKLMIVFGRTVFLFPKQLSNLDLTYSN